MASISIDVAYIEPDSKQTVPSLVKCVLIECCSDEQRKATGVRFLDSVFIHGNDKQIRAFAEAILKSLPDVCPDCPHPAHDGECDAELPDRNIGGLEQAAGPCGCRAKVEGERA